jgi:histidinol-phosphatase
MNPIDPRKAVSSLERERMVSTMLRITDVTRSHILKAVTEGFTVEEKPDGSLVTPVDMEAEQKARAIISETFPSHGFLGEEFGHTKPEAAVQWVIDPIDGTADFTRGVPLYGTVLAAFAGERPLMGVLDFPGLNLRVWASYGGGFKREGSALASSNVRPKPIISLPPLHSIGRFNLSPAFLEAARAKFPDHRSYWTCFSYALSSSGALDCSVELFCKIWDVAAAEILATENGKAVAWLQHPEPWAGGKCSMAIGDPTIVREIAALWKEHMTTLPK